MAWAMSHGPSGVALARVAWARRALNRYARARAMARVSAMRNRGGGGGELVPDWASWAKQLGGILPRA
jgi:hypothetical protein